MHSKLKPVLHRSRNSSVFKIWLILFRRKAIFCCCLFCNRKLQFIDKCVKYTINVQATSKGVIIAADLLLLLLETHPCPRSQQRHNNNQHVVSYPLSAGPGQTQRNGTERMEREFSFAKTIALTLW